MKKRKNFLLRSLVIAMIVGTSFGAGRMSRNSNNESEKHYLNWYCIGLLASASCDGETHDKSLDLLKKNPSLEDERELIEELGKELMEEIEKELSKDLPL